MQSHYCSDAFRCIARNRNSDENNLQAPILDRELLYLKSLRQANVRFAVFLSPSIGLSLSLSIFNFFSFVFCLVVIFRFFFSSFCLPVQKCNLCDVAPGARSFFSRFLTSKSNAHFCYYYDYLFTFRAFFFSVLFFFLSFSQMLVHLLSSTVHTVVIYLKMKIAVCNACTLCLIFFC